METSLEKNEGKAPLHIEDHVKAVLQKIKTDLGITDLKTGLGISGVITERILPGAIKAFLEGDTDAGERYIDAKTTGDGAGYTFTPGNAAKVINKIKEYIKDHEAEISDAPRNKTVKKEEPGATPATFAPETKVQTKEENEGLKTNGSGKGDGEVPPEDNEGKNTAEAQREERRKKERQWREGIKKETEEVEKIYEPSDRMVAYLDKKEKKNKKVSEKAEKQSINQYFKALAETSEKKENKRVFEKRVGFGTVTEKMKDIPELAPSLEDLEKRKILLEKDMENESPKAKKILEKELADLKKEIAEVSLIKEIFQNQIPQIVLHGNKGSYKDFNTKEKKEGFKPITDIDGLTSMSLINLAGIEYNVVHFVQKGEHEEGAMNVDTGGVDGARAVKAGKIPAGVRAVGVIKIGRKTYTLNIDNHGEGRDGKPSSAFSTYEILRRTGLLTEEKIKDAGWTKENLENMVQSVNELDSLSYKITPEAFKKEWARTFYGIAKSIPARIPISFIEEMFKKGISPKEVIYKAYTTPEIDKSLPKEEQENERERLNKEIQNKQQMEVRHFVEAVLGAGTTDEEKKKIEALTKNIYETSQQTQKLVYLSERGTSKTLEEMGQLGISKYTKELGRVLVDFIKEKENGNVSGKIPLGVLAAYGQGYDTWISWNERENSLFISKFKGNVSEIHAKIKKLFPHAEAVIRGAMIVVSPDKRDPNAPMVTTLQLAEALGLKTEPKMSPEKELAKITTEIETLDREIEEHKNKAREYDEKIAERNIRLFEIEMEELKDRFDDKEIDENKYKEELLNLEKKMPAKMRMDRMFKRIEEKDEEFIKSINERILKNKEKDQEEIKESQERFDELLKEQFQKELISLKQNGNEVFAQIPAFDRLTSDIDLAKMFPGLGITGTQKAVLRPGEEVSGRFPEFIKAFEEKYKVTVNHMRAEKDGVTIVLKEEK